MANSVYDDKLPGEHGAVGDESNAALSDSTTPYGAQAGPGSDPLAGVKKGEAAADGGGVSDSEAEPRGGLASKEFGLGGAAAGMATQAAATKAASAINPALGMAMKVKNAARGPGQHKKSIAGSFIALVLVIGAIFMSVAGPAGQAVQASQILQRDNASMQQTSSSRLQSMFTGQIGARDVGETRVGQLGRQYLRPALENLSNAGIDFKTNSVGVLKGATVDPDKLKSTFPELDGMSRAEQKSFIADKLGLTTDNLHFDTASSKFTINTTDQAFPLKTSELTKNSLSILGDGKILTGINTRVLANYFGDVSLFHPVKKAATSAADRAVTAAEAKKANEDRVRASISDPVAENTASLRASLKEKIDPSVQNIADKVLIPTAVVCSVRGAADDAIKFNHDAILVPAALEAVDMMSFGEQIKSGQDISTNQVGGFVSSFTDSSGKSIFQGKAFQVLAGNSNPSGPDLTPSLQQAFSSKTTANNLKKGADLPLAGLACSAPGQIVQLAAGALFFIINLPVDGGAASYATYTATQAASTAAFGGALYFFQHELTNLVKSKDVIPAVLSGPGGGNIAATGIRYADNIANFSAGAVNLSDSATSIISERQQQEDDAQFRSESMFARVFDIKDYRSLAGKMAMSMSPRLSQNIASLTNSFLNIGKLLPGSLGSLFTHKTDAATTYNWGFPKAGTPPSLLNDPDVANSGANSDATAQILDSSCLNSDGTTNTSCNYISKAMTCFGDEISKTDNVWDVVKKQAVDPNSDDYQNANCGDFSDPGWKRTTMFVTDTIVMKTAACYQGDAQSCNDIGVDTGSQSTATPETATDATDGTVTIKKLANPIPGAACGCTINPTGITLHWWGNQFGQGITPLVNTFKSNGLSVQVGITSKGDVYQMTKELNTKANHAIGGNATTIGIEIEGGPGEFGQDGIEKYPEKFNAVVNTVKYLVKKYNIPLDGPATCDAVVGVHPHSDYNNCPGAAQKSDIDSYYFNEVMKKVRE